VQAVPGLGAFLDGLLADGRSGNFASGLQQPGEEFTQRLGPHGIGQEAHQGIAAQDIQTLVLENCFETGGSFAGVSGSLAQLLRDICLGQFGQLIQGFLRVGTGPCGQVLSRVAVAVLAAEVKAGQL